MAPKPTSKDFDAKVATLKDWRGPVYVRLNTIILKADPEIVAVYSRLGAGKTHHSKAGSAADRCLAGRQ